MASFHISRSRFAHLRDLALGILLSKELAKMWKLTKEGKLTRIDPDSCPRLPDGVVITDVLANERFPESFTSTKHFLWHACRPFKTEIYWLWAYAIFQGVLKVIIPFLILAFLHQISQILNGNESWLRFLVVAFALILARIVSDLVFQSYGLVTRTIGQKIEAHINGRLFQRLIRWNFPPDHVSAEKIINHCSNDAKALADVTFATGNLIDAIVAAVGCFIFLWQLHGTASLAAIALFLACMVSAKWLSGRQTKLNKHCLRLLDQRLSALGGHLDGIRTIKSFCWEGQVEGKMAEIREKEAGAIERAIVNSSLNMTLFVALDVLSTSSTLLLSSLVGHTLSPASIFATIAAIRTLRTALDLIPRSATHTARVITAGDRLAAFLGNEGRREQESRGGSIQASIKAKNSGPIISINTSSPSGTSQCIEIFPGESVALIGESGQNKSQILRKVAAAAFAENYPRIGWLAQVPYLFNVSLIENLSLGAGFSESQVNNALHSVALLSDSTSERMSLEAGTGEAKTGVSGGQAQRLALARLAMRESDLVVLDDPFSALDDAAVRHIADRLLFGDWGDATRLVTTHRTDVLHRFDRVFKIQGGTFSPIAFSEAGRNTGLTDTEHREDAAASPSLPVSPPRLGATPSATARAKLRIAPSTYLDYFRRFSCSPGTSFPVWFVFSLILTGLFQATQMAYLWWLGHWAQKGPEALFGWMPNLSSGGVLTLTTLVFIVPILGFAFAKDWLPGLRGLKAGTSIFLDALGSILTAKPDFFSRTSTSQILNRFSQDQKTVDNDLRSSFVNTIYFSISSISGAISAAIAVPYMIIALVPAVFIFTKVQGPFRSLSAELSRHCSRTRSPRYAVIRDLVNGIDVIKTTKSEEWAWKRFQDSLYENMRARYSANLLERWFSVRMSILGATFFLLVVVSIYWTATSPGSKTISVATAGLAITGALDLSWILGRLAVSWASLDSGMVSMERLIEYSKEPRESGCDPSQHKWRGDSSDRPPSGVIPALEFLNVSAKYRKNAPLILNNINLQINPGEIVGIMGESGCGKSTILQIMGRFLDSCLGSIHVFGRPIQEMSPTETRQRVLVASQSPHLLPLTVRQNLDMNETISKESLLELLRELGLARKIESLPQGFDTPFETFSILLSQGEKQLLCLARTILSQCPIIALDEPTASLDSESERKVFGALRKHLQGRTLLLISHRGSFLQECSSIIHFSSGNCELISGHKNVRAFLALHTPGPRGDS